MYKLDKRGKQRRKEEHAARERRERTVSFAHAGDPQEVPPGSPTVFYREPAREYRRPDRSIEEPLETSEEEEAEKDPKPGTSVS